MKIVENFMDIVLTDNFTEPRTEVFKSAFISEHDLGKIDLQGIRAGKSRFPPEFREKYAENRCFSVAHKVMDKKYTWQHFVAGDNVPLEDVPIWIKEITYMIHDNSKIFHFG